MSWDVVIFNSRIKIQSIEEVDEGQLKPTDFCYVLENHFDEIKSDGNHRKIKGEDFVIDYFIDEEPVGNKILSLYGERALYELVVLAIKFNWQIFDTGIEQMIDLQNPSVNGYKNFHQYLEYVLRQKD